MKKILILATAAFLFSGVAFAGGGEKRNVQKVKSVAKKIRKQKIVVLKKKLQQLLLRLLLLLLKKHKDKEVTKLAGAIGISFFYAYPF